MKRQGRKICTGVLAGLLGVAGGMFVSGGFSSAQAQDFTSICPSGRNPLCTRCSVLGSCVRACYGGVVCKGSIKGRGCSGVVFRCSS